MSAARILGLTDAAFEMRVAPFVTAGDLAPADVHVVDLLAARAGGAHPDVLLALAFAVRAPRDGSAGIDLAALGEKLAGDRRGLALPDAGRWTAQVRAAEALVRAGRAGLHLDPRPFVHDGALLSMARYARHQEVLAASLLARRGPPGVVARGAKHAAGEAARVRWLEAPGLASDGQQRLAIERALDHSLLLLTGGPGTGKTHTLRRLLLALRALFQASAERDPEVALAAPTGKAAVRMGEVLHAADPDTTIEERRFLASLAPTTVHALLGVDPSRPGRFVHDAEAPLTADVVIVDEASMVDLSLMAKLVAAVRLDARLVLVGDPRQLASVEAGSVLADLVAPAATALAESRVELVQVHRTRTGTPLASLGAALTSGSPAALAEGVSLLDTASTGALADLAVHPHTHEGPSPDALAEVIAHHAGIVATVLAGSSAGGGASPEAAADALRRLGDLRLMAPHREGVFGVRGLSERVARAVAPIGFVWPDDTFPGMPVLVLENHADLRLANGDVGVLCRGAGGRALAAFAPASGVGPPRLLDRASLPSHEACFAMTVHKTQGSQYGTVVLVLPDAPSRLVTRELVYTALTRARQRFVLAGSPLVFRAALDRQIRRASSLASYLGD